MARLKLSDANIAVIGLGYVGLPLALALARHFPVSGYDVNPARRSDLIAGTDRTSEVSATDLTNASILFVDGVEELANSNVFIVTVPTPIDADKNPDLSALRDASQMVGKVLKPGAVVVFESTVYPGVTEDVCGPELERASGLVCGSDFFLGYSPERINPGDTIHSVSRIIKVVAGQTMAVAEFLADIYAAAVPAGVHVAPDIRTAEAAKVIENAQRDINIAFVNEVTMIFQRMGINTQEVLAAARTKWNFLDFQPGLVGGHCIGVDPFYLAHAAKTVGHNPEVILAGRRINDTMSIFVANEIDRRLEKPSRILVLGLTFKENVADLRNSKVADMISELQDRGHNVDVHDPLAEPSQAQALYSLKLIPNLEGGADYDAVVGAVGHDVFRQISGDRLQALFAPRGLLVDIKGIWQETMISGNIRRWRL